MLATVDLLAREVVTVELLQRQSEGVHVKAAACCRIRRDHCDARDGLDVHTITSPGRTLEHSRCLRAIGKPTLDLLRQAGRIDEAHVVLEEGVRLGELESTLPLGNLYADYVDEDGLAEATYRRNRGR